MNAPIVIRWGQGWRELHVSLLDDGGRHRPSVVLTKLRRNLVRTPSLDVPVGVLDELISALEELRDQLHGQGVRTRFSPKTTTGPATPTITRHASPEGDGAALPSPEGSDVR